MSAANRWKLATVLLFLCSLALAYRVLDQGITRTYLDASEETSRRHIDLLTGLGGHEWRGLPEEQVMSRLKSYVDSQQAGFIVLKRDADSGATEATEARRRRQTVQEAVARLRGYR